jgi:hypothetical protein
MDADDLLVMAYLRQIGASEVYRVKRFRAVRRRNGRSDSQRLVIEIWDGGPDKDAPDRRYHCVVRTDDGKAVAGNPARTLKEALGNVQWRELDLQPDKIKG